MKIRKRRKRNLQNFQMLALIIQSQAASPSSKTWRKNEPTKICWEMLIGSNYQNLAQDCLQENILKFNNGMGKSKRKIVMAFNQFQRAQVKVFIIIDNVVWIIYNFSLFVLFLSASAPILSLTPTFLLFIVLVFFLLLFSSSTASCLVFLSFQSTSRTLLHLLLLFLSLHLPFN